MPVSTSCCAVKARALAGLGGVLLIVGLPLRAVPLGAGEPLEISPPTTQRSYHYEIGPFTEEQLASRFTAEQIALLETLNRSTRTHLGRLDQLIVPDTWREDLAYSPFPLHSRWASIHPKALIVHQPAQAFAAYEFGRLVRWGAVSSGRQGHLTPSGLFHLNWRSKGRHSTVNSDWYMPWYFNFDNQEGLALHQFTLPGRPASHACVRLLERDAIWFYSWGEGWTLDERGWKVLTTGTPLWISGNYDFNSPPPWRSLDWLAHGIALPAEPIGEATNGVSSPTGPR